MVTGQNQETPRRVLVTGARTGIGLAIAQAFLRQGHKVVLTSRTIAVEGMSDAREEMVRYVSQGRAILIKSDLRSLDSCKQLIKQAVEALAGLDVLVNNAGGARPDTVGISFEDIKPDAWREHLALNLDSVFYLTQGALPHLKKSSGNVIIISSIGGMRPANVMMPYCVAKAGLDQLCRCLALEFAPSIRVNSINPGVVKTEFFAQAGMDKQQADEFVQSAEESYPLKRVGEPSDAASLAVFLADDEKSGWITGQNIVLDGGKLLAQ